MRICYVDEIFDISIRLVYNGFNPKGTKRRCCVSSPFCMYMKRRRPMDIGKYEIFADVAETKNFTKTGDRLGYTQPAVSRTLKMLERDMGFPLFIRGSSGVAEDLGHQRPAHRPSVDRLFFEHIKELASAHARPVPAGISGHQRRADGGRHGRYRRLGLGQYRGFRAPQSPPHRVARVDLTVPRPARRCSSKEGALSLHVCISPSRK